MGIGPTISFVANGNQHDMGYYLAGGIYPRWPVFVKTIRCPTDPKKIYFAQQQEAARKNVERAFGMLQAQWAALKGLTRLWYEDCIADVMYACLIMHNMIVENEGPELTDWANEDADVVGPSHGMVTANVRMGIPHVDVDRVRAFADLRQQEAHIRLQKDIYN
ncbi:uncharacterized protein LOC125221063 [Salvia hispanica]|uniref:uncharacterized protein LOC125221063 n=1 Tax=Salvia hispanica TaxID=49212 RepID=UPI00200901C3|nr:uncharacterized protein LOC125221063 [Salvia hispanica]